MPTGSRYNQFTSFPAKIFLQRKVARQLKVRRSHGNLQWLRLLTKKVLLNFFVYLFIPFPQLARSLITLRYHQCICCIFVNVVIRFSIWYAVLCRRIHIVCGFVHSPLLKTQMLKKNLASLQLQNLFAEKICFFFSFGD